MRNFSSRRLCASQQHWIFKLVCQFFNCLPWCSLHTSVSLWSCHYWTAAQSRPLLQRACIIAYLANEFEALVANWSRWLSCPPLRHYPHISSDRCSYINIIMHCCDSLWPKESCGSVSIGPHYFSDVSRGGSHCSQSHHSPTWLKNPHVNSSVGGNPNWEDLLLWALR